MMPALVTCTRHVTGKTEMVCTGTQHASLLFVSQGGLSVGYMCWVLGIIGEANPFVVAYNIQYVKFKPFMVINNIPYIVSSLVILLRLFSDSMSVYMVNPLFIHSTRAFWTTTFTVLVLSLN